MYTKILIITILLIVSLISGCVSQNEGTTTVELQTTIPKTLVDACNPCFSYFTYLDYDKETGTLLVKNGAKTIQIDSIVSNPAGAITVLCSADIPCVASDNIAITNVPNTAGANVEITITYTDTTSKLQYTDKATINN
jgi:hypothetical protein